MLAKRRCGSIREDLGSFEEGTEGKRWTKRLERKFNGIGAGLG